jgi:hypothetical protein
LLGVAGAPLSVVCDPRDATRPTWRALEKGGVIRVWSGILDSDDPSDTGPRSFMGWRGSAAAAAQVTCSAVDVLVTRRSHPQQNDRFLKWQCNPAREALGLAQQPKGVHVKDPEL